MSANRRSPPGRRGPERMRRQVIVLTILLIAVLVMLFYFRAWLDGLAEGTVAIEPERVPLVEPTPVPELIVEQGIDAPLPVMEIASPATTPPLPPPAPARVILLPARTTSRDPVAEALVNAIRGVTLRVLHGKPEIEVVDVSAAELVGIVPSNAGTLRQDRLVYLALTRHYDGTVIGELSEESPPEGTWWLIHSYVQRGNGSGGNSTSIDKNGIPRRGADPETLGTEFAERIARDAGRVADVVTERAQAMLAAVTSSEQDRLLASTQLLQSESHYAEAMAAAIDIATYSLSPQLRQQGWLILRQRTYDPMLAIPFSNALLTDPDASVRKEAAQGLAFYLFEGGSRPVLEHAARNDVSNDVRLAARMALMDYDEQQAFKHATLLDRGLTPAERLAPTMTFATDGPLPLRNSDPAELAEEALAYAEIVSGTDDADVKRDALARLTRTTVIGGGLNGPDTNPEIIRALVDSAAAPNEQVQRAALTAMLRYRQHPEVRAALEAVVENDPQLADDMNIARALAPPVTNDFLPPLTVR